ncbi:hypothetical protein GOP47_0027347 [Adiantum capillus-veneris]|nr:hypothetical protein GOP47_0027347 [Adiantum capillus-veneris]
MEEDPHFLGLRRPPSPLASAHSSCPLSPSYSNSANIAKDSSLNQLDDSLNFQILSSNLQSLISPFFDNKFSDVLFYVAGHPVPLHRCILAARCPFFMCLFSKDASYLASLAPIDESVNKTSPKLKIDLGRLFDTYPDIGKVSCEAFMTTMEFIYSGTRTLPAIPCIEDECLHEACRPVVGFSIDMLALASLLDITALKNLWQSRLHHVLEKAGADEVLLVLKAAKLHGTDSLLSRSVHLVAASEIGKVDIEKQLPEDLAVEVLALRRSMGLLQPEDLNPTHERECKRIRKALDSDDVELVRLLLKEGCVSLDQAHALHYAVSYCDPHAVKDVVELRLADVNLKNDRGFTPLHVASMRCDPSILVTLLSGGANPLETTPDGRTAFQISSRIMRKKNYYSNKSLSAQIDRLSVQILHQAETKGLFEDAAEIFPPTSNANELFMRLIYLENRIAVARLLFPLEAKVVTDICHLKSTSEFVGFGCSESSNMCREGKVDLEQVSSSHLSISKASMAAASMPTPVINEALLKRIDALQKCVIVGRKMFPGTVAILNNFTDDDDPLELRSIQAGTLKEQRQKKRRFRELQQALEAAFKKDFATMERCKFSLNGDPRSQNEED